MSLIGFLPSFEKTKPVSLVRSFQRLHSNATTGAESGTTWVSPTFTVRELGIGYVAYSPLGRGFLTGQIRSIDDLEEGDYRRNGPRFQGENFQKNLDLVHEIESMAQEKGCTPAQLALAWLLAQGEDVVPIPGTKKRARLEENVGALEVRITAQDRARIDAILPPGAAAGTRYAAPQMQALNR